MLEIVFVRNAAQGEDDNTLSQEGEAKCLRAGAILKEEFCFLPDLVITSGHPRCRRTGELIAQELGIQPRSVVMLEVEHPTLDKDTYRKYIAPIIEELGVKRPMEEYLARDPAGILLSHAKDVAREISSIALRHDAGRVLIVGHHITQNLIGIAQVGQDPILMGPEFEHLTGYWIHEDGSVTEVRLVD